MYAIRSYYVHEGQFYRIMTVITLSVVGLTSVLVGVLSNNISRLIYGIDKNRIGRLTGA